jgi:hypothetical protein
MDIYPFMLRHSKHSGPFFNKLSKFALSLAKDFTFKANQMLLNDWNGWNVLNCVSRSWVYCLRARGSL